MPDRPEARDRAPYTDTFYQILSSDPVLVEEVLARFPRMSMDDLRYLFDAFAGSNASHMEVYAGLLDNCDVYEPPTDYEDEDDNLVDEDTPFTDWHDSQMTRIRTFCMDRYFQQPGESQDL
jgi:hypothetical protein